MALLAGLCAGAVASGQATSPAIAVRAIAEVEVKVSENGQEVLRLSPADRVVPGDEVIYTIEIRNLGATDVPAPSVTRAVPEHMAYIAGSASGPGADITYSIDGGNTFARPELLTAPGQDGQLHVAMDKDYTHIRWQLKNTLKSKSVAFARFRALVK